MNPTDNMKAKNLARDIGEELHAQIVTDDR